MGFFNKDFKVQTESKYAKLIEGENRFRFIGEPITGSLYWVETKEGRRPVRIPAGKEIPVGEIPADGLKQFVAAIVWNYTLKKLQILEITQKTILQALVALDSSEDWGKLTDYDITINRTGKGKNDTKFSVMPSPKKALSDDVQALVNNTRVDLNELFNNGDPFNPGQKLSEAEQLAQAKDSGDPEWI